MAGSEYQRLAHGAAAGSPPRLEVASELAAAAAVRELVRSRVASSAHDLALGGLAVTLAESCIAGGLGATIQPPMSKPGPAPASWDWGVLFGETSGRYLVSVAPDRAVEFGEVCEHQGVPGVRLGVVGGDSIVIAGMAEISLEGATMAYSGALAAVMDHI
ncbi:protein containing AIR synthase related protein [mine drainage metagenome]|uniref:Protein containing AIR synthase related protein n=1 Tax=mine drainage metagenome TaxID=410659 RepID=T0Y767_9ZZZZ